MRLTAFDTDTGLRTDKLSAELLALAHPFGGVIGNREQPDADESDGDGEQRRVFVWEDGFLVSEDLHPNGRAKDH